MKKDVKKFLIILLIAIVLFFLLPLLINLQPNEQVSIIGTQVIYLILHTVFMGVVGWVVQKFEKLGWTVPLFLTVLHVVSQILFFQGLLLVMILNYLEIAYMIYFLRKVLDRRKKIEEAKKKPQAFPSSVKRK